MKEIQLKDIVPSAGDRAKALADEIASGVVDIDVRKTADGYEIVRGAQRLGVQLDLHGTAPVRDLETREVFSVRRDDSGTIVRA